MNHATRNRILAVILIAFMLLGTFVTYLGSQNNNKPEQTSEKISQAADADARKAVTDYFNALQKGDFQAAKAVMTEDATDGMGLEKMKSSLHDNLQRNSSEANALVEELFGNYLQQTVREYAITDSGQDQDHAVFLVTLTSADMSKQEEVDMQKSVDEVNEWASQNQPTLQQIASEQGEEAAQDYLAQKQLQIYFGQLADAFKAAPDTIINLSVGVEKNGDTWKIKGVHLNQGQIPME